MMIRGMICLLLLPFALVAHSSSLSFDDLISTTLANPPNNTEVEVRGFLYTSTDGRLILAAEPNLKTCCVGTGPKSLQQITIIGGEHLPKTNRAMTLKGTFFYTTQGESPLYFLKNPTIVEEKHRMEWALFALTAAAIGYFLYQRKQRH